MTTAPNPQLLPAILLLALLACPLASQTLCPKGDYLSQDGRCLHDQTGESHPVGDGCNTATCMDAACHFTTQTTLYCTQGDEPLSPFGGSVPQLVPTQPPQPTPQQILSNDLPALGNAILGLNLEARKRPCHTTFWRWVRGYRKPWWCAP
jgi:hypothetical protein